jgi:hypothetical protein
MSYQVKKVEVWAGEIDDQAGGLAAKLEPLADAKVDLQFLIARRQPHVPGKGIVFLSGLKGARAARAATAAGLSKAANLFSLRVEGPNKPGACYALTRRLADAGINLRGVSAGVMGKKFLLFLAFDSADDAATAARLARASGGKKK